MSGQSTRPDGAFPFLRYPSRGFMAHALLALLMLVALNVMLVVWVPFEIKFLRSSYLIFFYHFPSAMNVFLLYGGLMGASVLYLRTKDPVWDRRARAAAEIGVLANAVLLVTGSTWARAAWNTWWVWDDPRLMSAAVMSLVYVGYLMLQGAIEEPSTRRRTCAVYGILAFVNIPVVHFSIKWFGQTSHPMKFDEFGSDPAIVTTRWYGVLAFLVFYLLLFRWSFDRITLSERVENVLGRVRGVEERRATR